VVLASGQGTATNTAICEAAGSDEKAEINTLKGLNS
jgi:hypothetical protein